MRRPPRDFRERFQRIIYSTLVTFDPGLHRFRNEWDYDHFLEVTAIECIDERHLAFNFICRFMPFLNDRYAEAVAIAVMEFLSQSLGRPEPDGADLQAAKALLEMPVKTPEHYTNWLNSYYEFPA